MKIERTEEEKMGWPQTVSNIAFYAMLVAIFFAMAWCCVNGGTAK